MQELDDINLLREYTERGSEKAFTALVERHINKVYSVALRHTHNPHQAEEITQAVFVILASKANHLGKSVILEGWLYQTARLTATTLIRSEIRRGRREQEAHMQNVLDENESQVWTQIAPQLDAALARLNSTDRNAVVLRFFYGKNMGEIGAALGATEEGARKRVNRALEKLRKYFFKHGVTSTTATIAGAISANSVQAAPATLAKTISAIAISKGATASTSTLILIKGALKIMAWSKMKTAIGVGVAILIAGGAATALFSNNISKNKNSVAYIHKPDEPAAVAILQKALTRYATMSTYTDSGMAVITTQNSLTNTFKIKLGQPNYYLVEWDQRTLPEFSFKGAIWSAGNGDYILNQAAGGDTIFKRMKDAYAAQVEGMGFSGEASFFIPSFFQEAKQNHGRVSGSLAQGKDDTFDGIDCYVLTETLNDRIIARWIGKQDLLIHQIQTQYLTLPAQKPVSIDDATIEKALVKLGKPVSADTMVWMRSQIQEVDQNSANSKSYTVTEIHQNIVVNQPLTKNDFIYDVPNGLKLQE